MADTCEVGDVVLPGDTLTDLKESESTGKIILGPGLRTDGDNITVIKPGVLKFKAPNCYWIDSHQRRYIPVRGENVLGIVVAKAGDVFRVDIGGCELATLSYLAFEGATKRNRPDVKIGDIVYCKLLIANKDMEPELVCIDGLGKSSGLGVIRMEGFMFKCSLNLVRKILSPECCLLNKMGNCLPYEIAVGMNGRLWIKGRSLPETIAICNCVSAAEYMNNTQIKAMVKQTVNSLTGI